MNKSIRFQVGGCLLAIFLMSVPTGSAWVPQGPVGPSYHEWRSWGELGQAGYLKGYADAEVIYRATFDSLVPNQGAARDLLKSIAKETPLPPTLTTGALHDGIKEFYSDWRNQTVSVINARRIALLQIAGRSKSEIEDAISKARQEAAKHHGP